MEPLVATRKTPASSAKVPSAAAKPPATKASSAGTRAMSAAAKPEASPKARPVLVRDGFAMPEADYPRLVHESSIALQVCTAGNLRTTLMLGRMMREANRFDRCE